MELVKEAAAVEALRETGFAILAPALATAAWLSDDTPRLVTSWGDLPIDAHLADGGRYRFRRHASLVQQVEAASTAALASVPYRPHWQPAEYNKLHGGYFRHFAEIRPEVTANASYRDLIVGLGALFAAVRPTPIWHVESHQFRIDPSEGEGRPTPEGAHRDGVDYVALVMIAREGIRGGVTTVYDRDKRCVAEFTLATPWSIMLLDDQRVTHATTPIHADGPRPHRDTLVLTYRAAGFLQPDAASV